MLRTLSPWDERVRHWAHRTVAPTQQPVNLEFVRHQHMRQVNDAAEDPFIERGIEAGTQLAESFTGRALVDQTWALNLDRFPPSGRIELPRSPLDSVTSITYTDTDGNGQTLATSEYVVHAPGGDNPGPGWVERAYDVTWPDVRIGDAAVVVTFVAGYGIDTDVPSLIRHGIAQYAAEFAKMRSNTMVGVGVTLQPTQSSAEALWSHYKLYGPAEIST